MGHALTVACGVAEMILWSGLTTPRLGVLSATLAIRRSPIADADQPSRALLRHGSRFTTRPDGAPRGVPSARHPRRYDDEAWRRLLENGLPPKISGRPLPAQPLLGLGHQARWSRPPSSPARQGPRPPASPPGFSRRHSCAARRRAEADCLELVGSEAVWVADCDGAGGDGGVSGLINRFAGKRRG